ncbi:GlsB/YeaQ/YmgE family stress response membrane protein [Monaibacterium marinum]|uniref:GlsB/YeaQ/YmgE family stress response membrane protein n=1 Tax=Pontivivens marinum TaxID=1690039 RepID=UPI0011AFACAB|nr:GlsB/YeaQ/YmgE family stress response membrane protein [Monaibacterium marinum]
MSEGTIWLIYIIGGVIGAVILLAVIEYAYRSKQKPRTFVEKFDIDPAKFREVHTSFGNPLGHSDIAKANDYMRDQAVKARAQETKEPRK